MAVVPKSVLRHVNGRARAHIQRRVANHRGKVCNFDIHTELSAVKTQTDQHTDSVDGLNKKEPNCKWHGTVIVSAIEVFINYAGLNYVHTVAVAQSTHLPNYSAVF